MLRLIPIAFGIAMMSCIASTIAASDSDSEEIKMDGVYTVVAPAKLRPNSMYQVTVSGHNIKEPLEAVIGLKGPGDVEQAEAKKTTLQELKETLAKDEVKQLNFNIGNWIAGDYQLIVNITSGKAKYNNDVQVRYDGKTVSTFIQTDKAIYKPGELVNFRVIVIDAQLQPTYNDSIVVSLFDAKKNRLKKWPAVPVNHGVAELNYQLSDTPPLGSYQIRAEIASRRQDKSFDVAEYTLPEFEVNVRVPQYITYKNSKVTVEIDAYYTHGQPIKGELQLTAKQRYYYPSYEADFWPEDQPEAEVVVKKEIAGSTTVELELVKSLRLKKFDYEVEMEFIAVVKEKQTGKNMTKSAYCKLDERDIKVDLVNSGEFRPGLPFTAKVRVARKDDTPGYDANGDNTLLIGYKYSTQNKFTDQKVQLPENGLYTLPLAPSRNDTKVTIRAIFRGQKYQVAQLYSKTSDSNNYLLFTVSNTNRKQNPKEKLDSDIPYVQVGDNLQFDVLATEQLNTLNVHLVAKGAIQKAFVVNAQGNGAKFAVNVTQEMAPKLRVIAFYVRKDNKEFVGYTAEIYVDGSFRNPITLKSSVNSTEPGNDVQLTAKTTSGSYVGFLGVDQSLLLLKSGNDIEKKQVEDELNSYDSSYGAAYRGSRNKKSIYRPHGDDLFSHNGLIVISNGQVWRQYNIQPYYMKATAMPMAGVPMEVMDSESASFSGGVLRTSTRRYQPSSAVAPVRLRKHFPETWIWQSSIADKSGVAVVSSKVPDTITSWIVTAFSLHKTSGFGLLDTPTKVTVFRPFFIKLNLPYSIVKGEAAQIQVLVFNYQKQAVTATVTLNNKLGEFNITELVSGSAQPQVRGPQEQRVQKISVEPNDVASISYMITSNKVGDIKLSLDAVCANAGDRIEKLLKVKAPGQIQYRNKATLVNFGTDGGSLNLTEVIRIPDEAIVGSKRIELTANGDILATTMQNLDDLLRMPYGCGEQNLINFVPNIVVLDYLKKSGKLTPTLKLKAIRNMESGYQRQLNYQRLDGSFSAFGEKDTNGSTWLSAFVLSAFSQAKSHIQVDDNIIGKIVPFLLARRNADGSYNEEGVVHHRALQGGISGKDSTTGKHSNLDALTAYVIISMHSAVKSGKLDSKELQQSELYLVNRLNARTANATANNYYQVALITYALHLIDSKSKDSAFEKLMKLKQVNEIDDYHYWDETKKKDADKRRPNYYYDYLPNSAAVEATSYAILTQLLRGQVNEAVPALKWIISKQNSNGGFASTQDTVIGLKVLAEFALRLQANVTQLNVNYQLPAINIRKQLIVNAESVLAPQSIVVTDLEYQNVSSTDLNSKISQLQIAASGKGSAVLQASWQYNLLTKDQGKRFNLTAEITGKGNGNEIIGNNDDVDEFDLKICAAYLAGDATNMAVIQVEMPSGFQLSQNSIDQLKNNQLIKRVDLKDFDSTAVIYFDSITKESTCVEVTGERKFKVTNLKEATVLVYDYYKNTEMTRVFYTPFTSTVTSDDN